MIDVCGVSPRELDTESVPMETFRQHKVGIIVGMRQNVKFIVTRTAIGNAVLAANDY